MYFPISGETDLSWSLITSIFLIFIYFIYFFFFCIVGLYLPERYCQIIYLKMFIIIFFYLFFFDSIRVFFYSFNIKVRTRKMSENLLDKVKFNPSDKVKQNKFNEPFNLWWRNFFFFNHKIIKWMTISNYKDVYDNVYIVVDIFWFQS